MPLTKTWFTVAEAESKFGVPGPTVLKWVEDGLVRAEGSGRELRVNVNDLELKIEESVLK